MTREDLDKYMGKLEGKAALITGGTSGIGLATAKAFVTQGASVGANRLHKAVPHSPRASHRTA